MPSPDVYQTIFRNSLSVNLIRTDKDTSVNLQKLLAQKVKTALADIGSGWEVAWEPVVWKRWPWYKYTPFGNAWYVSKHDALEFEDGKKYRTCVVNIAGTASNNAVVEQDADIGRVIHPDSWASSGIDSLKTAPTKHTNAPPTSEDVPMISNGFGQAVHRLINHTMAKSDQPSLGEFLKSQAESHPDTKFVFAGHSLGAALACSTAYVLTKGKVLPQGNVLVYPTAGPSPGNMPFVNSFKELFPSSEGTLTGYQHWNTNIINPLDVVPCGYCTDGKYTTQTLDKVSTMYGAPAVPYVQSMVDILLGRAKNAYYPITCSTIESTIDLPPSAPKTAEEFMAAGLPQHEKPYLDRILGDDSKSVFNVQEEIKSLLTPVSEEEAAAATEGTE